MTIAAVVAIVAILATWVLEREPAPLSADGDGRAFSGERAQAQPRLLTTSPQRRS